MTAADTSSAPADSNPVVGPAAAALAALTEEPMPAKSVADAAKNSGITTRNDIAASCHFPTDRALREQMLSLS